MYEDLFLPGEHYHITSHPKLRIAVDAGRAVPRDLYEQVFQLLSAAQNDQSERILALLSKLVPEYQPVGLFASVTKVQALDRTPSHIEFPSYNLTDGTLVTEESPR
jgi:hypothetical protein